MDDISRHALTIARMDAQHSHTARLCQERCESFHTALDYGPPPPAADQERLPEAMPNASEDQPNQVSSTPQGLLDHHHTTEDPWNPIRTEPLSGSRLEPVGETTLGPLKDYPDQPNRVPPTPQSALPLPEPDVTTDSPATLCGLPGQKLVNVTGNTPPVPVEASMEPPTQPEGDGTTTPTDNHDGGSPDREGHIADGSDKGRLKKDPKKQQTYQSDRSAPGRCSSTTNYHPRLEGTAITPRARRPGPTGSYSAISCVGLGEPCRHSNGSPYRYSASTEFPAQKCRTEKKVLARDQEPSYLVHGCRIPPDLTDTTCASQERATPRCDFSRIAAGKTIFLHFRCSYDKSSFGAEQITL